MHWFYSIRFLAQRDGIHEATLTFPMFMSMIGHLRCVKFYILSQSWVLAVFGAVVLKANDFLVPITESCSCWKITKYKHFEGHSKHFLVFLVPRWAVAVLFFTAVFENYWIPQNTSFHCPVSQYRIPHEILATVPTAHLCF